MCVCMHTREAGGGILLTSVILPDRCLHSARRASMLIRRHLQGAPLIAPDVK